jgi:RNA polymerase sigma factor (TIGR02999 family)
MPSEVTQALQALERGDPRASDELLPMVYEELRRLAAARLAHEPAGATIQPTALVHEAWLRLAGAHQPLWNSRGHFFGAAAEAMRRILIDRARKRRCARHGAGLHRVALDSVEVATTTDDETLLRLNDALDTLAAEAPNAAELVKLRFFTGLPLVEAAQAQGISLATAKRRWAYARSWLLCELRHPGLVSGGPPPKNIEVA